MLCLSGFELYSRWVPETVQTENFTTSLSAPEVKKFVPSGC